MTSESSTGLPPRLAAALAYGGWWITGALLWLVERRDMYVRFHAAQSLVAFGVLPSRLPASSGWRSSRCSLAPAPFSAVPRRGRRDGLGAVLLWVVAVTQAIRGVRWRMPMIGGLAERLAAKTRTFCLNPES